MKKIMFNDRYGLTTAVLQDRKTMTRRVCKEYATGQLILASDVESFLFYPKNNIVKFLMKDGTIKVSVPPYKDNEVVAVAQSYNTICTDFEKLNEVRCMCGRDVTKDKSWTNKLYVQPCLMPHQIQITDINIEHLQNISDEDCMKEGIMYNNEVGFENGCYYFNDYEGFKTPKSAFCTLINRINGKSSWEINPFVFAYSFKLIK